MSTNTHNGTKPKKDHKIPQFLPISRKKKWTVISESKVHSLTKKKKKIVQYHLNSLKEVREEWSVSEEGEHEVVRWEGGDVGTRKGRGKVERKG